MMKNIKYVILLVLIALASFFVYQKFFSAKDVVILPPAQDYQDFVNTTSSAVIATSTPKPPVVISNTNSQPIVNENNEPVVLARDKINLNVPFTSQAPTANWDEPFQNACEEASLMMLYYYHQNKKMPDKSAVEKIIVDMVAWQVKTWGLHPELPIEKEAALGLAMYNQEMEIVNDLTVAKIKALLDQGRPVIIPADGKKLNNPNFRNGGPVYHVLVIKGYIDDKFITNDPGTRLGADYIYTQDNLMYSIADWDEAKYAAVGPKVGLVFKLK